MKKPKFLSIAAVLLVTAPLHALAQYEEYDAYSSYDGYEGYDTGSKAGISGTFGRAGGSGSGSSWTAAAAAEWTSKYLREGRRQFGRAGVIGLTGSIAYNPLELELWQGFADSNAGREFQGTLRFKHQFEELLFGMRVTHISDTRSGPDDWEFGATLLGDLFYGVKWKGDVYFGDQSNAVYTEGTLFKEWKPAPEWLLTAAGKLGANLGYVRDGHRGPDHLLLNVEIARSISTRGRVFGGLGHQFAIDRNESRRPGDARLHDGWLLNLGTSWSY